MYVCTRIVAIIEMCGVIIGTSEIFEGIHLCAGVMERLPKT